jgi:predicted nucleic acid-binding protein
VATCLPFLLETGYFARKADDHDQLIEELLALPLISLDEGIERRAIDAQRQLARVGHHRLPPVDLILAASPIATVSASCTTTATSTSFAARPT